MQSKKKTQKIQEQEKQKKGISLIVLILTIVVMVILAAAIIITLNNSNVINSAKDAVDKTNLRQAQEIASIAWTKAYSEGKVTVDELKEAVENSLRQTMGNDVLSKYEAVVTQKGVTVLLKTTQGLDIITTLGMTYATMPGTNLWNNTVTFTVPSGEFTLEQKKEIVVFLMGYSDYEGFVDFVGDEPQEEEIDSVISILAKYIDYSDEEKLEELGIKKISIKTPYNNTLYSTNLGGEVKCTLNQNGNYNFVIGYEGFEQTEKISIENIKQASTSAPYKVRLRELDTFLDKTCDLVYMLEYSIDDTNEWHKFGDIVEVECTNSISFRFDESVTSEIKGTTSYVASYVEKDSEFYKYYIDSPYGWISNAASQLFKCNELYGSESSDFKFRQTYCETVMMCYFLPEYNEYLDLFLGLTPSDFNLWEGVADSGFGLWVLLAIIQDVERVLPEYLTNKYPQIEIGNYNAFYWGAAAGNTSEIPVYTIDLTHDMDLYFFVNEFN